MDRSANFSPELESTRGIAALLVAGFHVCQAKAFINGNPETLFEIGTKSPDIVTQWSVSFLKILFTGQGAVTFFFVLSGYVLFLSLERADNRARDGIAFAVRRFFRIYPAAAGTVLFMTLVYFTTGLGLDPPSFDLAPVVRNLLLLSVSIDGVMWTLQVEFLAVPLIFLVYLMGRRFGPVAIYTAAIVLSIMIYWRPWYTLLALPSGPPRAAFMYAFIYGMAAFDLSKRLRTVSWRMTAFGLGVATPLFFAAPFLSYRYGDLIQAGCAATIIVGLVSRNKGWWTDFLRLPQLRFLGRVSYSFYLLHPLTLAVIWYMPETFGKIIAAGVPLPLLCVFLWVATSAVMLPLAQLSYRFIELPGLALGRTVLSLYNSRREGILRSLTAPR